MQIDQTVLYDFTRAVRATFVRADVGSTNFHLQMSTDFSEHEADAAAGLTETNPQLHSKSFKLRFASQRELGRSYVSAVKPLRLPAVVSAKFYRREPAREVDEARAARALHRVTEMFRRGPREKYDSPVTTSQQYGWWWDKARFIEEPSRGDRRLHHHIQDSAWLKERLRVLATDTSFKRL